MMTTLDRLDARIENRFLLLCNKDLMLEGKCDTDLFMVDF